MRTATLTLLLVVGCAPARVAPAQTSTPDKHADKHAEKHVDHRFEDARKWAARFESPKRDGWQQPDYVIGHLALEKSSVVADIGSATGYFPVRISPHVPKGRVWGVDIEPDMVRWLNARARNESLDNVFSVLAVPDDPLLPERVDVVLIVNTYHHISKRTEYFRNLRHYLNPGARVAVVDFRRDAEGGPPKHLRPLPEEVTREMKAAGYQLIASPDDLPRQYMLIYAVLPP